jgi:hypothetical protein
MTSKAVMRVLLCLVLMTALPKYEIYTFPFLNMQNVSIIVLLIYSMNILFILAPLLALYMHVKAIRFQYVWLGIFAIPAFLFGVMPIPFATYLYSDNHFINTIFIGIFNVVLIVVSGFLFKECKNNQRPITSDT